MSIAQSILANPSKYSLAQLTQGVQNGVIPAYIGVPIIQEKMQEQARMQAMGQDQGQGQQPPIAEQVLQQADAQTSQQPGVDQLSSNLPESYAGGGIIAFDEGGSVERFQTGGSSGGSLYPYNAPEAGKFTYFPAETAEKRRRREYLNTPEGRAEQARADRASLMALPAAAGDVLVGGPYNAAAALTTKLANTIGVPRMGRALGIYGPDVTSVEVPRIGTGTATPFFDKLRTYAAGQEPTPAAAAAAQPAAAAAQPAAAAVKKPGINTLIPRRPTPTAGAPTALGQGPFAIPAAPKPAQSMEDLARKEFETLEQRSDRRTKDLLEAQAKNKMEGKPFDSLKKTLEDEAAQSGVEKSDAKAMAIFKAGLAMMSGTSRHALENIGKGAMTGAEDYQKAAADLKKADKERQKQLAAIDEARRAEDRDDMKTRNAQLEKASTAAQRMDELGTNAIMAGTGKDRDFATDVWKTEYSGGKTIEAAKISAGATMGAAQLGADARVQAAELRAALLAGGAPKGALTQDQLIKNRQALADSPQIAEYKKQLIAQYGKNVVNQPGFQENINQRIDQLLMQMAARPGATTAGPKLTPEQQSLLNKYLSPQ
jgi:hypothetical protein